MRGFVFARRGIGRPDQQSRIGFVILDRGIVRPDAEHVGQDGVHFFRVALGVGQTQPAILRDAQLRRGRRGAVVGGFGDLRVSIFLGIFSEGKKFL